MHTLFAIIGTGLAGAAFLSCAAFLVSRRFLKWRGTLAALCGASGVFVVALALEALADTARLDLFFAALPLLLFGAPLLLFRVFRDPNTEAFAPEVRSQILITALLAALVSALLPGALFLPERATSFFATLFSAASVMLALNFLLLALRFATLNPEDAPGKVRFRVVGIFWFLLVQFAAIGTLWSALYFYAEAERVVLEQAKRYVSAVATSRAAHIGTNVGVTKYIVGVHAENPAIRACLDSPARCPDDALNALLRERLRDADPALYLLAVLDENGVVVGATDADLVGEDWSARPAFTEADKNGFLSDMFKDERANMIAMEASAPIVQGGELIGVYVERLKPLYIYAALEDRTNLGESGETYLVNENNTQLSPRRFDKGTLRAAPDAPHLNSCARDLAGQAVETPGGLVFKAHERDVFVFENQYGRALIGTHAEVAGLFDDVRWCVIAEMGTSEILAPLERELLKAALLVAAALLICLALFSDVFNFFLSRVLSGK